MALKIFWSKKALQNFEKIILYIEDNFGDTPTKSFVNKVHKSINLLQEFPELGTLENPEHQIRGLVILKQVTLFYRIYDDHIRILNLFDNRQHPGKK